MKMTRSEIDKLFNSAMVVAEQYVDNLDDRGEMTKLERELTLLESSRYIVMDRTVPKSRLDDNKDALDDALKERIKYAINDAVQKETHANGLGSIANDQTTLAILTEFALILRDSVKMGADMAVSFAVQAAKNGTNPNMYDRSARNDNFERPNHERQNCEQQNREAQNHEQQQNNENHQGDAAQNNDEEGEISYSQF